MIAGQTELRFDVPWTTLAEFLAHLERRGVSTNFASIIGAETIRTHVLGLHHDPPTPAQLDAMRELVRREMEAGALGIGSALVYSPGLYAKTDELIELCKVAAKYRGKYFSHMRYEGTRLVEGVEELIRISREAGLPAEIYHFKVVGERNRPKLDQAIAMIERARREGLKISANMYTYIAGGTGLTSQIPIWAHEGGNAALFRRLDDPATRAKLAAEMHKRGPLPHAIIVGVRTKQLKPLMGKSLDEIARMRGEDPVDTVLNLVREDRSRIATVFFLTDEDSLRKIMRLPWVSFGSDGGSMATEGAFLESLTHPRAFGNFARLLGKYVRDEKVIPLSEAIHRLSGLPAANLGLDHRGLLQEGMFADVVVFDRQTIADRATFESPQQYAVGIKHVFVNGVQVLRDGEHTGAKPGRALFGPGKVR
jgi:N-acyl-D-amino-acid deacylase